MAVTFDEYAPFDAGAGANVTEATWRKMMIHAGKYNGVMMSFDNELNVFGDSSGLQVKVNTGQVWIQGHWGAVTSTKTLPIATAHASNPRIDRVVARADFVNNRVELDVITGTPAGSPTTPSLTQNSSIHEISLGRVAVAAGVSTITSGNVTDMRTYDSARARYRKNTTQSLNNDTNTKITFPTNVHLSGDIVPDGDFDEFTLGRTGWWLISSCLSWATGTTGFRRIEIGDSTLTNSYAKSRIGAAGDQIQLNVHTQTYLTAGTVMSIYGRHTQGSSLNVDASENGSWVSFVWLGF